MAEHLKKKLRKAYLGLVWNTVTLIFALALMYFVVACSVFQYRNPTANGMQVIPYFWSVVTWKKLEKFQGRGDG